MRKLVKATRLPALLAFAAFGAVLAVGQDKGAKAELPADLARVPADAYLLQSFRLGELWAGDAGKAVRAVAGKDYPQLLKDAEAALGSPPEAVERLTLVFVGLQGAEPMIFVSTAKPVDRPKVIASAAPGAAEEKRKGQTLHATDKKAVYFLGEKAYLVGLPTDVRGLIDDAGSKTDGPLAGAVRLAAGKHHAVTAVNVTRIAQEVGGALPPSAAPFKALLEARSATMTVDVGAEAKAELKVTFAGEKQAKEGVKALKALQFLARGGLAETIKQAQQDLETAKFVEDLKRLDQGLKTAEVAEDGAAVRAVLTVKTDLTATATSVIQATQKVREAANRMKGSNNLKQLGLAMHNYHDKHGAFPPHAVYSKDGKPLLSWRVLLLPYLEQENLYKEFKLDEPWDSEHNKKLLAKMPNLFAQPGTTGGSDTVYLAFTGKDTLFEGSKGKPIVAIADGSSNTILFVETKPPVPWTKPEDLKFEAGKPLPKLGGLFPAGFNSAFCDGSVRFISDRIDEKVLRLLIMPNDGQPIPN